ncbi:MAG: radical SAM protein [Bdellovibrionota bacterium]
MLWLSFFWVLLKSNLRLLKHPFKYFVVVTKSCNSRCKSCLIWTEKPKPELTLEEFTEIAKNSPHLYWLTASGGEPTNRPDFPEIVEAFKRECPNLLMVNFTTNGIDSQRILDHVRRIASLGIRHLAVNVSLDGPPEVHDQIRGVRGNFVTAVETFNGIKKIPGVKARLGMTLGESNGHLVEETIASLKQHVPGFKRSWMHFNLPHTSEHYYLNKKSQARIGDRVLKGFENLKRKIPFSLSPTAVVERLYHGLAERYLKSGQTPLPCSALQSSMYISEQGDVFPCTIWNRKIANLKEHAWNPKALQELPAYRQALKEIREGHCPQCWTPCEAYQTILSNVIRVPVHSRSWRFSAPSMER